MNFTKINPADLNSPRQDLSNGGLGIVAALLVLWQIDFCRLILDVQSRCVMGGYKDVLFASTDYQIKDISNCVTDNEICGVLRGKYVYIYLVFHA